MNALSPLVYGLIFQKRFSASITEAGYVPRWSVLDNLKLGPLSSRWSWSSNTLATRCEVLTHWKRPLIMGKIEGKRRGTEDEHHQLNGHEFEQTLGDSEGQGRLACCSPWDCRESGPTKWLNSNKNSKYQTWSFIFQCSKIYIGASLVAQVENLPTVWETQVQSLRWEDP